MDDVRKHRGARRDFFTLVLRAAGVLALALLCVVSVRAAWGMYGKFASAAAAREGVEAQQAALAGQYSQVAAEVKSFSSERGLEAEVRERWGYGRPGEGEIDIVRQTAPTSPAAAAPQGLWQRLWHALFVW